MNIKYVISILALILLLSACGTSTILNIDVDVLTFLSEEDLSYASPISTGIDQPIPDESGFDLAGLGIPTEALSGIEGLSLTLGTRLTMSDLTDSVTATLELYLSEAAPVFSATPIAETVNLAPNAAQDVEFTIELSETENTGLLASLQSGTLLIGARFVTSGTPGAVGSIEAQLTKFDLSLATELAGILKF